MSSRSFNANSSRYGFNGKENDNEVVGTGSGTQDYGMRIYNSTLGRFLTVDPLKDKFAMLTPYQYATNRPIDGVDLDGQEWNNYKSFIKAAIYGVNSLEIQTADDGIGNTQTQLYTLKAHGNSQDFSKLKATMLNSPQEITNNYWAEYKPVQKSDPDILSGGDEIMITLQSAGRLFSPIFVRVMSVNSTENSFSMTFATLEGHTDAGYITFSGILDPKTNTITFSILNETREAIGAGEYIPGSRSIQIDQWEDVMGNAKKH